MLRKYFQYFYIEITSIDYIESFSPPYAGRCLNAAPPKVEYKKHFELRYTKLQFERGAVLKGEMQFKKFLILQLTNKQIIQAALLMLCVWCAKALNQKVTN
jgi:hypothetical protein